MYKKGERTARKFKTIKFPKTHTHTHRETKENTVSETPNNSNTNTHTHTHTHNYEHIKYQRQVMQTKVNTPQEKGRMTLIKTRLTNQRKQEWVQILLSTPLTRTCAYYVLWRKQQAGNIHTYIHTYIHMCVCKNVCKNRINKFKKHKSLRGPSYLKHILILSLDLQQSSLHTHTYI